MFKIALVDDHELFRKSLIFVLEQIETGNQPAKHEKTDVKLIIRNSSCLKERK